MFLFLSDDIVLVVDWLPKIWKN